MAANFKAADRFPDRDFVPLGIAVIAVSDTRSLETDTAGALLVSLLEADGHRAHERVVVKDDVQAIRAAVQRFVEWDGGRLARQPVESLGDQLRRGEAPVLL